jgi:hypothetical protein
MTIELIPSPQMNYSFTFYMIQAGTGTLGALKRVRDVKVAFPWNRSTMGRVPNVAVRKALVAQDLSVPRRHSFRRSAQATRFALHRRGRRCRTRGRVRYNLLAAALPEK